MDGHAELHTRARHLRQSGIIDPKMAGMTALIAGVGMIGGWTALALSRAVGELVVYDPDTVSDHNVGCQPYHSQDIGIPKVEALQAMMHGLPLQGFQTEFPDLVADELYGADPRRSLALPTVVISAIDSMEGRRQAATWARDHSIPLFLDGRILGELAVLASADSPESYDRYLRELPDDESVPDVTCGQQGTAYTGLAVASQIVASVNQWCKGASVEPMRVWHVGLAVGVPQEKE